MSDLGSLSVWQDSAIRGALSWYLAVAENQHPAKFRIAATLATDIDPATSSEEALWAELDRLTPTFLARWRTISAGASLPEAAEGPSLLELCRELTYRMLAHCNFCPWSRGIGLETVKTALAAGHSVRALPVRRQAYLSKIRASRRCQGTHSIAIRSGTKLAVITS